MFNSGAIALCIYTARKQELWKKMVSFTITNKKADGFFMVLLLVHASSGILLTVREKYVAGKITVTRKRLNAIESHSSDLANIGKWSDLVDLGEFVERDIQGLNQLPQNEWVEYFLPQLDDLEYNAVANFELIDWFRQFGFVEKRSNFEIKGGIKILPKKIDQQDSKNKISLENKFFDDTEFGDERNGLVNETNPKKFTKMHLKLLKGGHR